MHTTTHATIPSSAVTANAESKSRMASIDLIRGAAMILMAIDHVRVYSGIPPGGPTPAVFFTRWITHFCAPAFIFFTIKGPDITLRSTVMCGKRSNCWNTMPTRARKRASVRPCGID